MIIVRYGWHIVDPAIKGTVAVTDSIEEEGEDVTNKSGEVFSREIGSVFEMLWRWALGFVHAFGIFWGYFAIWGIYILFLYLFTLLLVAISGSPADTINTIEKVGTVGQHGYNWFAGGSNEAIDYAEVLLPPQNAIWKFSFALVRLAAIRLVPLIGQVDGDASTSQVADYLRGARKIDCTGTSEDCGSTFADFITGRHADNRYADGFGDPALRLVEKPINDPNDIGDANSGSGSRRVLKNKPLFDTKFHPFIHFLESTGDPATQRVARSLHFQNGYNNDVETPRNRRNLIRARWFNNEQFKRLLLNISTWVGFGIDRLGELLLLVMDLALVIIAPIYTLLADILVGALKVGFCALTNPRCAGVELGQIFGDAGIAIGIAIYNGAIVPLAEFFGAGDIARVDIDSINFNIACSRQNLLDAYVPCFCSGSLLGVNAAGNLEVFSGLYSNGKRCQNRECHCDQDEDGVYRTYCVENGITEELVASEDPDIGCSQARRALSAVGHQQNLEEIHAWWMPQEYDLCIGGVRLRARPQMASIFLPYEHTLEHVEDEPCGDETAQENKRRRLVDEKFTTGTNTGTKAYIMHVMGHSNEFSF
ncbi:MAG: hypothetical protein ACTSUE_09060, partial [Promethearchaeota archaeon]